MELYHISCEEYTVGQVLKITTLSRYHEATLSDNRAWINDYLDNLRPDNYPSRKMSFYACDSLTHCKALKSTASRGGCKPKIYIVRMVDPVKVPMALVSQALANGEGNPINSDLASEYWQPKSAWRFYEYLAEEMEILKEVENKDLTPMGQMVFWASDNSSLVDDAKMAKEKFVG